MSADELHALHRRVPLGTLAHFDNGAAFKPSEWESTGKPIIRIQNLTDPNAPFNRTTKALPEKVQVRHGELLYSWSASLGVHIWTGEEAVLNQHIFKVTPTPGVEKEYLYYLLDHMTYELQAKTHGSTMKHVTKGDFESTLVPVPSLNKQRRIVDILNRANGIRRLRREALAKARQLIPALFVEMFGDPATNPKKWPEITLGGLLDFITSGSRGWAKYHVDNGARFIRVQDLRGHHLQSNGGAFVNPPRTAETQRTLVQPADLLLAITGASIGLTGIVPPSIGLAHVSQHVAILRFRPNKADPKFVQCYLSDLRGGQRQIASLQYGQTKPGLGLEQIRQLKIFSPPIQLQHIFSKHLADINGIIIEQERAAVAADQLVASLMAQCFEG